MKYITYFALILILFPINSTWAAGERYRVEVLVLTHLEHSEPPVEVHSLTDYSGAVDLALPPEPLDDACTAEEGLLLLDENSALTAGEALTEDPVQPGEVLTAEGETAGDTLEPDPNALVHITELGPEMQDAWRRLRLSGPFRPLQYLAWEQGSEEPFPELRIHDDTVVLHDDPYSDLRENPDSIAVRDEPDDTAPGQAGDCEAPHPADNLPDPTLYYALDGKVSLVRTRFLHLRLDLQVREALMDSGMPMREAGVSTRIDHSLQQPVGFRVHELRQSRQVRSGRMEYFDGPVIGVLAWLTTIPLEDTGER